MDALYHQGSECETQRAHTYREELAERIARAMPEDGTAEPLEGLRLNRSSTPTEPLHGVSQSSFCVIAQGSEEVLLQGGHGDEPLAVPETAPAPGGAAPHAGRAPGCCQRRLPGGLRRR